MPHFLIVRFGVQPWTALHWVLGERRRPVVEVDVSADGAPSADLAEVRGVVLLGEPGADESVRRLVPAWNAVDVPVLALGGAARLLLPAGPLAAAEPRFTALQPLAEAADDLVLGTLAAGTVVFADAPMPDPAGATVLATDGAGQPIAARTAARAYAFGFRPEVGAAELADLLAAAGRAELAEEASRRSAHVLAAGHALLGRWVDLVVGRLDSEAPWGRKGPQPVPGPGMSLHPA